MTIVGGFDVHRKQITFDYVDSETGEVRSGQICPATRKTVQSWLGKHCPGGDAEFALEACTGWRFVAEELTAMGAIAHLADAAETAGLRGPKKRAKTDRVDARLLRTLLWEGRLPEAVIPPAQVLEVRTVGRLYCALMEERRAWQQRIHAQLFHQGCPPIRAVLTNAGREALANAELSAAGRQYVDTALRRVDELTDQIGPLRTQLGDFARRQLGCRALQRQYGVGPLGAAILWAEIGDARRFSSSEQLVRYAGLDITVYSSDGQTLAGAPVPPRFTRAALDGVRSRQIRRPCRFADHAYYQKVAARRDGKRAALAVARKVLRRSHHILCELGDAALAPPDPQSKAA
jgi:transposase